MLVDSVWVSILYANSLCRLSGVVTMQGIIYFRMFEGDGKGVKLIVRSILTKS